jgi:chromatin remodeling complex protein RSC6
MVAASWVLRGQRKPLMSSQACSLLEEGKVAKKKAKRKPNAAFMRPMTISAALAAVVGSKPIPRTQVTKKLWDYIKKNKLQDNVNRRMINADAALKKVFGGKSKVSMFEMTKLVSKHLS